MMRLLAIDLEYTLLLYMYISYVAENQTKEQYHVGTITYNTVLQNGCLRYLREINSLAIGSGTYTTGFYDSARAGIWKEDELTDPVTGKFIRARLRGVDYEYGFEIVLNKEPALEKVLDIRMITNKSLPFRLFILHLKTKTMLL
jgi:hypothetical protein